MCGNTYNCAKANLDRLNDGEVLMGLLRSEHEAAAGYWCMVDVVREEDGGHGCCEIWKRSSQAEEVGFAGYFVECECLFDSFLFFMLAYHSEYHGCYRMAVVAMQHQSENSKPTKSLFKAPNTSASGTPAPPASFGADSKTV